MYVHLIFGIYDLHVQFGEHIFSNTYLVIIFEVCDAVSCVLAYICNCIGTVVHYICNLTAMIYVQCYFVSWLMSMISYMAHLCIYSYPIYPSNSWHICPVW